MRRRKTELTAEQKQTQQKEQQLDGAIHDALDCARDRVVRAAVNLVQCEDEGHDHYEQLEDAVDTFTHIDTIHDALAEVRQAKRYPEPGVIDLDAPFVPQVVKPVESGVKQAEIPHETVTEEVMAAMLSPEYSGIVEVTPSGERPIMRKELKARA